MKFANATVGLSYKIIIPQTIEVFNIKEIMITLKRYASSHS